MMKFVKYFICWGLISIMANAGCSNDHCVARVRNDIIELDDACQLYYKENGRWPSSVEEGNVEITWLSNFYTSNISGVVSSSYIELTKKQLVSMQRLDPWGHPYLAIFDKDADGVVGVKGSTVHTNHLIWSCGKNEINENGRGDDISILSLGDISKCRASKLENSR